MNFGMTPAEQKAATQAMGGSTPGGMMHLILFTCTVLAVVWACFVLTGIFRRYIQNRAALEDVLFEAAVAVVILILACVYTIYT